MTSQPIRDPLADHLITPQNSAFLLIDWQPDQISTVRSMDQDLLLRNAVSTVRTAKSGVWSIFRQGRLWHYAVARRPKHEPDPVALDFAILSPGGMPARQCGP